MKKLSEICKLSGVTRRTLQEYNKIGLLKPTAKTEAGYWLYDDQALDLLSIILIFVEVGYERKAIKNILESYTLEMLSLEYDQVIEKLEAKQKKIDGMIKLIKTLKLMLEMPESTLKAIGNLDFTRIYQGKSISAFLKEAISEYSNFNEEESELSPDFFAFSVNLIALGSFLGNPIDSIPVQNAVKATYESFSKAIASEEDPSEELLSEDDKIEIFYEVMQDTIKDPEFFGFIEQQCGDGALDFMIQAIQVYRDISTDNSPAK